MIEDLKTLKISSTMKKDKLIIKAKEFQAIGLELLKEKDLVTKKLNEIEIETNRALDNASIEVSNYKAELITKQKLIENQRVELEDLKDLINQIKDLLKDFSWWKVFSVIEKIRELIKDFKRED